MAGALHILWPEEPKRRLNSRRETERFAGTSGVGRELLRRRHKKEQAELLERFQQMDDDGAAEAEPRMRFSKS